MPVSSPDQPAQTGAADELAARARTHRPTGRPTMKDLADHLGVSRQLVSLALRGLPGASDETRERVRRAAGELGYYPDASARLLRGRRSYQIGVLFTMRQPFEIDLVEALLAAAAERGFTLVLGPLSPTRHHSEVIRELLGHRIEALVVLAADDGASTIDGLPSQLPVVQLGGPRGTRAIDDVRVDNELGVRLLMDHLIALGHERITHVSGGDGPNADERRATYEAEMTRRGLADHIDVIASTYSETGGSLAADALLRRATLPSALVCANDRCAVGVLETLVRAGLTVPDDISIVGFDDSSVASLPFVRLTTMRHDPGDLARLAIDAVVRRIGDPDSEPVAARESPRLVVRSTTAPPPSRTARRTPPTS